MGKNKTGKKNSPGPIGHAVRLISSHPATIPNSLAGPYNLTGFWVEYKFSIEVSLPQKYRKTGISYTGVRKVEDIILRFNSLTYPYNAPKVLLRKTFPRSFPHINPGSNDDYVRPCIFDGPMDELLFQEDGIYGLINHLSEWLKRAAGGTLINPMQGWEPIRRDFAECGFVICDLDLMRSSISSRRDYRTFLCQYLLIDKFGGLIQESTLSKTFGDKVEVMEVNQYGQNYIKGVTIGIMVWPDELKEDLTPFYNDSYLPETVTNYADLLELARLYRVVEPITEAIEIIKKTLKDKRAAPLNLIVPIIFCARRPFPIIGEDSTFEFIPYLLNYETDNFYRIRAKSSVFPLLHKYKLSRGVLGMMSTGQKTIPNGRIGIIGCGSLGSKITLHLARGGYGPFALFDNRYLSPHNLARHALTDAGVAVMRPKAEALFKEIEIFPTGKDSVYRNVNIVDLMSSEKLLEDIKIMIDSTACDTVREYLAVSEKKRSIPIMRVSLFAEGRVGAILIEGKNRNPRVDDLYVRLFDCAIEDKELSRALLSSSGQRYQVGQNCGSFTTIMPDTVVSLYAAGMAEKAKRILQDGFSDFGEIIIGKLQDNMGLTWSSIMLNETVIVENHNAKGWEIRLLNDAVRGMITESEQYGVVETGGLLLGRISITRRCITISRVLPAPPDSRRTESEFILGTEGLKAAVKQAQDSSGILRYLGTWHSHPMGGAHSYKDRRMLEKMKELRFPVPSVCLICKPDGFACLVDEGEFGIN